MPPRLDLWTVLSESKRIINAHSRHFLALSVLFLLPLSFSLSVYPTLRHLISQSPSNVGTHLRLSQQNPPDTIPSKILLLSLLYVLFVFLFSLAGAGSTTYSVIHGFYGRPVKLLAAVKSSFTSFFRLLATSLVAEIILSGVLVSFGVVFISAIKGAELIGFHLDLFSPYVLAFSAVLAFLLILILVYFHINWTLALVIAVVESRWGFEPLKRSTNLIRGMRRVAFSLLIFFGFFAGVLAWGTSISPAGLVNAGEKWWSWMFVADIVVSSALLMLLMLYNFAANTVLYMYCKAFHGELAGEIAEEFAREYVSLPFDEEKVPHVVSVVYRRGV